MKNPGKLLIVVVLTVLLAGCSNKANLLVKTWMVENLKYTKQIPPELQPQIDQAVEGIRRSFRLTYKADGTYSTTNNGQVLNGKWVLNWNSTVISSTTDKGEKKDYKIMELTGSKFTFKAIEGGEEVIFEMVPAK